MAITKNSSKSESWTVRIPNDLANDVRQKFPDGTGNTQIVIEAIKHLLGIDSSLYNITSNTDLTEVKKELEEIRSRLSALEHQNNISLVQSDRSAVIAEADQEWMSLDAIAKVLNVKPKSITTAVSKRGQQQDDGTMVIEMNNRIIYKQGKGLTALYQLQ